MKNTYFTNMANNKILSAFFEIRPFKKAKLI
jgi:hypothetical protein